MSQTLLQINPFRTGLETNRLSFQRVASYVKGARFGHLLALWCQSLRVDHGEYSLKPSMHAFFVWSSPFSTLFPSKFPLLRFVFSRFHLSALRSSQSSLGSQYVFSTLTAAFCFVESSSLPASCTSTGLSQCQVGQLMLTEKE